MRIQPVLEKYLPLVSNMLAASVIFAAALLTFLIKENFNFATALFFHWSFYGLTFVSIVALLHFNRGRWLFMIVTAALVYCLINVLKQSVGEGFEQTVAFQNIKLLLPYNLLFFYWFPLKKFMSRKSFLYLCGVCIEYSLCEFLSKINIVMEFKEYDVAVIAALGFALLAVSALIRASKSGGLYDYTVLFYAFGLGCALFFAKQADALSLFFCVAQVLACIEIGYELIRHYFYDVTGVYSRNSYMRQAKHLPQKYSLGIIQVDNYEQLLKTIGSRHQQSMDKLISGIIEEMAADAMIYRYAADTYVLIYKALDRKELHKEIDAIRHKIAGLFFEYAKNKKAIKLTVSGSAAEKKRSDVGVENVLRRAEEELQKTLKFSHNITVMA